MPAAADVLHRQPTWQVPDAEDAHGRIGPDGEAIGHDDVHRAVLAHRQEGRLQQSPLIGGVLDGLERERVVERGAGERQEGAIGSDEAGLDALFLA